MDGLAFFLSVLACMGHGRRVRPSIINLRFTPSTPLAEKQQPVKWVERVRGNVAAAFNPPDPATRSSRGSGKGREPEVTFRKFESLKRMVPTKQDSFSHRVSEINMDVAPTPLPRDPREKDQKRYMFNPLGDDWQVGKLSDGQVYLWRETSDPDDPEVQFVEYAEDKDEEQVVYKGDMSNDTSADQTNEPSNRWKPGMLTCGQKYLWRETQSSDNLEILLIRPSDGDCLEKDDWRLDYLPSGKPYLWRWADDPANPEVRMWNMPEDIGELSTQDVPEVDFKKEVLDFRTKHLGRAHAHTLKAMNDYTAALIEANQMAEADPLCREALELTHRILGAEHPETIRASTNFAGHEPRQKHVLEVSRRVLGPEHPDTLKALNNYAMMLGDTLGRVEEAEPFFKEVLEVTSLVRGSAHPDMLRALRNYAITLDQLGREAEAEPLKKEVLRHTRRFFNEEHFSTIKAVNSYAATLSKLGRHAEAEMLHSEVLDIAEKVFGHSHPVTLMALKNYALAVRNIGHEDSAQKLNMQVRELALFWSQFAGFGTITRHMGPFCRVGADAFFKMMEEQQQDMIQFVNHYE